MKRFTFDQVTDFSDFFSGDNHEVTDAIVAGIKKAMESNKKIADVFELGFDEEDNFFEVQLPLSEWPQALSACMTKYEDAERYDDVIDTFELLKKATDLV